MFLPELSPASTRYPTNPALIQLTPATDHEPDTRQLAEGTEPIRRFISLRPVGSHQAIRSLKNETSVTYYWHVTPPRAELAGD